MKNKFAVLLALSASTTFAALPTPDITGIKINSSMQDFTSYVKDPSKAYKVQSGKYADGGSKTIAITADKKNEFVAAATVDNKIYRLRKITTPDDDKKITVPTLISALTEKYGKLKITPQILNSCLKTNGAPAVCSFAWRYHRDGTFAGVSGFTGNQAVDSLCETEATGMGNGMITNMQPFSPYLDIDDGFKQLSPTCGLVVKASIETKNGYVSLYTTDIYDPKPHFDALAAKESTKTQKATAEFEKNKTNKPSL